MEDQEDKNNEQGFLKEQEGKLKEKGKEQAKKNVRKQIIAFVISQLVTFLTTIGLPLIIVIVVITFFAGFVDMLGSDKSKNASDAKVAAISYTLETATGENAANNTNTIKISNNNGIYNISNNYNEEDIKNIKNKISETGEDVSNFTDFEIGIIGALMENGLDIDDYTTEELKCLPLFIKTEACTRYLDLRPNSEKFDKSGNYQPQKLENLKESEVPGVILVQRTNTSEEFPKNLEYINLSSFNDMVSQKNVDALNYFTIDENNNLVVAKWEYTKVEVTGTYPSGVEETTPKDEYSFGLEKIPYNEYIKKYTMPFDFLMQLLVMSEEADFCRELTDIITDSKIVINIQEEETTKISIDEQTYTVYTKEKKTVSYDVISSSSEDNNTALPSQDSDESSSSEDSDTSSSSQDNNTALPSQDSDELSSSQDNNTALPSQDSDTSSSNEDDKGESKKEESEIESSQDYNVKVTTTSRTHQYTVEIKEADTWLAHYIKEYKKSIKEESTEGPDTSEILGEYGENPIYKNTSLDDNKQEIEKFEKSKEKELNNGKNSSVSCEVTGIEIKSYQKIDEKHTTTVKTEKYPSDPNPTTSTDIYAKDENGNFEKFLSVYDKYAYTRDMMDSASDWLFDMMEENSNTIDLIDPVKYLLYVYDGTDHGVTDIDASVFKPSEFKSTVNSKGIIVKTDEPLAIQALTKEQIEEIINKNFTGQGKENLLSAIEGFMYIQDTYKVNAVFAIAVTKAESGCGTGWAAIDSSTYNWCSMQGSYNGNSYTSANGKSWRKYSSFDEAIRDFGDWIATSGYYFKAERYTVADIAVPYCDEIWGETVTKYVKEMYESIGVSIYTGEGNDVQQNIVEVASNASNYGITAEKGYCQAWVSNVYYRAGANSSYASVCCATHAGAQWGVSTDFNQIQLGATVYGNYIYQGVDYGHVGIYIGDGMVAHNVGGVKVDDLDDWIKSYNGVCWGWNGGTDLTGGSYPCKKGLMTPNH